MDGAPSPPPLILPLFLPLCLVSSRTWQPHGTSLSPGEGHTDALADPRLEGGWGCCFLSGLDVLTVPWPRGTHRKRKTLPPRAVTLTERSLGGLRPQSCVRMVSPEGPALRCFAAGGAEFCPAVRLAQAQPMAQLQGAEPRLLPPSLRDSESSHPGCSPTLTFTSTSDNGAPGNCSGCAWVPVPGSSNSLLHCPDPSSILTPSDPSTQVREGEIRLKGRI